MTVSSHEDVRQVDSEFGVTSLDDSESIILDDRDLVVVTSVMIEDSGAHIMGC